jgi:transposase-like protein
VRNGHRHSEFDTRAGPLDVAIPKLREGSYFPDSEDDPGEQVGRA